MEFKMDTSGRVETVAGSGTALNYYTWDRLSPFVQGYVEAMIADLYKPEARGWSWSHAHGGYIRDNHRKPQTTGNRWDDFPSDVDAAEAWDIDGVGNLPTFSDLAPETLARIIADCVEREDGWRYSNILIRKDDATEGSLFWRERQMGASTAFPPLTVQLGDDGKVRFA